VPAPSPPRTNRPPHLHRLLHSLPAETLALIPILMASNGDCARRGGGTPTLHLAHRAPTRLPGRKSTPAICSPRTPVLRCLISAAASPPATCTGGALSRRLSTRTTASGFTTALPSRPSRPRPPSSQLRSSPRSFHSRNCRPLRRASLRCSTWTSSQR
jgi:hypothetical protein